MTTPMLYGLYMRVDYIEYHRAPSGTLFSTAPPGCIGSVHFITHLIGIGEENDQAIFCSVYGFYDVKQRFLFSRIAE